MKINKWILALTIVILCCYGITMYSIKQQKVANLTLSEFNDITKTIEEKMSASGTFTKEEQDALHRIYGIEFEVVLQGSELYDKKVYKAISERAVMMDLTLDGVGKGKVIFPISRQGEKELQQQLLKMGTLMVGILLLFVWGMGYYIYVTFLRPFHELERFASNVAAGNFDFSLHMKKKNYFGAFTESFDLMREELEEARRGEYEANKSKKELVASLSHDIKTPVSTIKAYCELLTMKLNEEELLHKVEIIDRKADMIDHLISDMFHATLEELSMLKIQVREELSSIINGMLEEMNHDGKLSVEQAIPECLIVCDALRLSQVIDNVINNSRKYANTRIEVRGTLEQGYLTLRIKDFGPGIAEDDLPLLCSKFYRGSNSITVTGSGLGLYLANVFMEGMNGHLEVYNEQGFVVALSIPIVG